jgi:FlaA1/EpsC-like NDP-sugar epimerase
LKPASDSQLRLASYRSARRIYLLAAYAVGLALSLWLAFQLRFDFQVSEEYLVHFNEMLLVGVGVKLALLVLAGQFGSRLSFFGLHDLGRILAVCFVAAAVGLAVWTIAGTTFAPPRAVILTDFLLSFLFLCGFRLSLRLLREGFFLRVDQSTHKRVVLIGANDVGASLVKDLLARRGLGMRPIAFFDDDPSQWGTSIHGVPVEGSPESLRDFAGRHKIDEAIIALPSVAGRRIREIVTLLNAQHLRFEIVPSLEQLVTGKVRASQIRPVEIQDLLGRRPVDLQADRIRELIRGRVVLVTGAGGSIGGELCRQIAALAPERLLLIERSEFLLFQIEQELHSLGFDAEILPLVADVLDVARMEEIFRRFRPAVVFHAAAHKHVPMMEHQPAEAFRNNSLGTLRLADLAVTWGVDRFTLISTDKAINPTNVMGATKRIAELYIQALNREQSAATKFMAVRFGNVLGSSGSVIPTFRRQIAAGGPITVTHPEVTRYFMTVNEAVGLVLQSATLGQGGEIFVLDMGTPIKIVDIARQLIELSGLEPESDIEIKFTGLRPGEKLFEEISASSEKHSATEHPKVMRLVCEPQSLPPLKRSLEQLGAELTALSVDETKKRLQQLVPEYRPQFGAK